jgi:hypothetical protein
MSRGLSLERVVEFFRESNLDVAEITLMHVTNIVGKRKSTVVTKVSQPSVVRKQRKPRKGTLAGAISGGQAAVTTGPDGQSLAGA